MKINIFRIFKCINSIMACYYLKNKSRLVNSIMCSSLRVCVNLCLLNKHTGRVEDNVADFPFNCLPLAMAFMCIKGCWQSAQPLHVHLSSFHCLHMRSQKGLDLI